MFKLKLLFLLLTLCTTVSAATYYVSPLGDNVNKGTSEGRPFQSVQYAIDQMKTGDTLVVLDGLYTGTLKLKSGITMRAKNPRKAIFGGVESLQGTSFTLHSGNVYKAKIGTPPKQLFYQNKPMTWASWPNVTWADNWVMSKRWVTGDQVDSDKGINADFSSIKGLDLTGGVCYLRDKFSVRRHNIKSFDGTKLTLESTDDRGRTKSSIFFLAGAVDLVDSPGEWAYKDNTLYFYPPDGKQPKGAELYSQTNDYSINEAQAVSDITIEGVDFFATAVKLESPGNKNIDFRNVHFTYTGGEVDYNGNQLQRETMRSIQMAGTNILFDKCLFAGARHSALTFANAPNFTVQNCVFMENNPTGSFSARALVLRSKGSFVVTRNTFFNVNSDAMSLGFSGFQGADTPQISYNNIFNAGVFNPDVSGVYLPKLNQHWTEFHHNWVHNCNGNALRLDVAGKELSVHHNVFWGSKRGMSIEGYGQFNIYNNTDVLNHVASDIIRNILNHEGANDASFDQSFPPIDDWNVLNNIVEAFDDSIGPREKSLYAARKEKGLVHSERAKSDEIYGQHIRPFEGALRILDRGSIQGNLVGKNPDIFTNGNLSGLNLIPIDKSIREGVSQTEELASEGITDLDSFRGAYDVGEKNGWVPGSDWMPYGLPVLKTMAESEAFAKKVRPGSILPEINVADLPRGHLDKTINK